jgi:serine/threonine protein kinase
LQSKLGEGGFGVVWVAEQLEPVRRQVALKIIRPGMDSREVIARFEVERQALALMEHPNIARVFDGGVRKRSAVLRDGAGVGCAHHAVLRRDVNWARR